MSRTRNLSTFFGKMEAKVAMAKNKISETIAKDNFTVIS